MDSVGAKSWDLVTLAGEGPAKPVLRSTSQAGLREAGSPLGRAPGPGCPHAESGLSPWPDPDARWRCEALGWGWDVCWADGEGPPETQVGRMAQCRLPGPARAEGPGRAGGKRGCESWDKGPFAVPAGSLDVPECPGVAPGGCPCSPGVPHSDAGRGPGQRPEAGLPGQRRLGNQPAGRHRAPCREAPPRPPPLTPGPLSGCCRGVLGSYKGPAARTVQLGTIGTHWALHRPVLGSTRQKPGRGHLAHAGVTRGTRSQQTPTEAAG